ncbi:MAG: 1-pyrroline-5-carboxylate dehydrogenase [Vibrio sp.]
MQPITRFSEVTIFDAKTAWEQWNLTDYRFKHECLVSVARNLEQKQPNLAAVVNYHLQHIQSLLSEPKLMPGPTGETNELYSSGRGLAAVVVEPHLEAKDAWPAVMAQLVCALMAGNGVILCCDDIELNQQLEAAISGVLPAHLVHIVAYDSYQQVLNSDVRIVASVGSEQTVAKINRLLANKLGVIVPLVSEVIEPDSITNTLIAAHDPSLVLRFITERTRTINITAIGGNATLLELGNQH